MGGAEEIEKSLVVAVIDAKRLHMLNLKSGACATSPPVRSSIFTFMIGSCVHALRNLGGDVAGLGWLIVFGNLV